MSELTMDELFNMHVDQDKEKESVAQPTHPQGWHSYRFASITPKRLDEDHKLWPGRAVINVRVVDANNPSVSFWEQFSPEYYEFNGAADELFKKWSLYKAAHGLEDKTPGAVVEHMADSVTEWYTLAQSRKPDEKKWASIKTEADIKAAVKQGLEVRNKFASNPNTARQPKV